MELAEHLGELERLGVPPIELVIVDFYPLKAAVADPKATLESVIEMTDIGGPTMLRSAAKGLRLVVCDPQDRQRVVNAIKHGEDLDALALELGAKAEAAVAEYCLTSARFRSKGEYDGIIGRRVATCKYGENPYQVPAGLYMTDSDDPLAHDKFKLVEGTEPSFIGNTDRERLLATITHIAAGFEANGFGAPCIAIAVKHGNPCAAAASHEPLEAIARMVVGDPIAIFGGVVMTNFAIDMTHAEALLHYGLVSGQERRLLDGVIAPRFSDGAVEVLARKKGKCRLTTNLALEHLGVQSLDAAPRLTYLRGGFQLQPNYSFVLDFKDPRLTIIGATDKTVEQDLLLAWAIGCTSNSNTITLVHNGQLIGNAVGQQDRVGACNLAIDRAQRSGHNPLGAAAYSDSFFPFVDGPAVLYDAGIAAIFASSGSVRDDEVKQFCQQKGITLYLMPDAVCRGFFGH